MPNIKSVIKDVKKSRQRHLRNQSVKSALKTYVKKARQAVDVADFQAAPDAVVLASRKLDKAVSKGIIHKNQAARRKSRLMKRLNKAQAAAALTEA
ncbi:MAG: 30S ribosomal protein S20 [Armatimonadetes bacterium]|nr:30S ribosomal protein S20 [Armatimonadota bacterium]